MMENTGEKNNAFGDQSGLFRQISDICAAVNAVRNGKELLEVSLSETLALFGAQRGSIFILKENGKDLILKTARGMEVKERVEIVKRLGEGVVGQVAVTKKPIVVDDIAKDQRFSNFKARKSYRTPSFICAPLLIKDKLIGVINISDKASGQKFSPQELQLLDFLSSQIALNYRRIELYQKFKTVIKESQTLKNELGKSSLETTILKRQVVLQEKLASIGKLAGGIAHEFNNPLDGVLRYTNLCLEHVREDEVVRGYLLEIKHGLNRMAEIVRSLLACSRQVETAGKKIGPNEAAENALKALQTEIIHKDIQVETRLQDGLPQLVDFGLERVLQNLIRNAIDAMNDHGRIFIATSRKSGEVLIEVVDTGTGISRESMERIFEPFYTTKDIDKGCGLGLTIVSEIVKSYNGQIHVESAVNQGTKFAVTIPVKSNEQS
ncbi:MAG: ATP-binding protein [Candidatus Omnitrophota bacterium]|nr:ATP-binding protein [Candidatus Omnitrophota bacterium]